MKKVIAMSLAAIMLLFSLVSCASGDEESTDTSEAVTTVGDDGKVIEYDEKGYQKDALGNMDFGGQEIKILAWDEIVDKIPEYEVSFEDMGSDVVKNSVYQRNLAVQTRLNVQLKFEMIHGWTGPGDGSGRELLTRVRNSAGTNEIDIIASYSWNPSTMMMEGLISDLTQAPHLDLTAPWWNQSVLEKCSVYDHVYYATGDIAPSLINETFAVFFNKTVASDYKLGDIYEIYENDEWTLEKLMTISESVGSDENDDGQKDPNDKYGFTTTLVATDAFYQGSGMVTIENAPDGSLLISDDFGSEKTQTLLSTLVDFLEREDSCFSYTDSVYNNAWKKGNVLFTLQPFSAVKNWVTGTSTDAAKIEFGLLPMPKYDDNQEEYLTTCGFYFTMYSIARAAARNEGVGATLECLASESYRKVTPAFYENVLQTRYAGTEKESQMFDTVRQSVVIDSGRVFNQHFGANTWLPFRDALFSSNTGWMSIYDGMSSSLEEKVGVLNTTIDTLNSVYGN